MLCFFIPCRLRCNDVRGSTTELVLWEVLRMDNMTVLCIGIRQRVASKSAKNTYFSPFFRLTNHNFIVTGSPRPWHISLLGLLCASIYTMRTERKLWRGEHFLFKCALIARGDRADAIPLLRFWEKIARNSMKMTILGH